MSISPEKLKRMGPQRKVKPTVAQRRLAEEFVAMWHFGDEAPEELQGGQ